MQQRDPFTWADDYNKQSTALGAQGEANAQDTLIRMFAAEAQRQQPYNDLPVDLAKQNNQYKNMYDNTVAVAQQKQSIKDNEIPAPPKIASMVTQYSKTYNRDPDAMLVRAQIESGFNPRAISPTGAKGLFQFVGGTAKQYGLDNPFDVEANIKATMQLDIDNEKILTQYGVEASPANLYLAHQQGAAGAAKLLSNPNASAESVVGPRAVRVNGGRAGMTAGQFAGMWTNKFDRLYKQRVESRKRSMPTVQEFTWNDEVVAPTDPSQTEDQTNGAT